MKALRLLFAFALVAAAQETVTNESIIKMATAGLGEGLIVSMVQGQPGKYSVSPDDLTRLKQAGVSDRVVAAMIAKGSSPASAPAT
jgi:hypothetical protein